VAQVGRKFVFIPIGDSPNPKGTPWVTWFLIGINVAVFLLLLPTSWSPADPGDPAFREYLRLLVEGGRVPAGVSLEDVARSISGYDLVIFDYGFRPGAPTLLTMFTCMFLHGGWQHLAGNMLFLWIYGDNVEHRLGKVAFVCVYLGTGLAATIVDGMIRWGSGVPTVGASGAISGILGAYFIWFPHNRVKVFVFLFPFIMTTVAIPARIVLGIYLVIDNLLPFLLAGGGGGAGVAYGAHIGGFVAGLGVAALVAKKGLGGGEERAARLSPTARLSVGYGLARQGKNAEALRVFQRLIADQRGGELEAQAHLAAAEVQLATPGLETAAYQHLFEALDVTRDPVLRDRVATLLRMLETRGPQA
jgi:membrane associated rhomboid family serine protease